MKISTTAISITSLFVSVANAAAADALKEEEEKEYAIDLPSSWLSQLACTVDVAGGQPSLVADETICASTKDDSGRPCLWCDATSSIGSGVCVSSDQKSMMSTYWEQFCVASHSVDEPLQQQQQLSLDEGDWLSQLACNVDISGQQPSLIDEDTCASTKDATGHSCVWCDASTTIGSGGGVCVSPDQKALLGQFWDQLCSAEGSSPATPPPATPPPTTPPPVPAPAPDNNTVPDELKCTMDASSNIISDEVACVAQKDVNGGNCVWCEVPILGGTCITSDMKSELSFLCSSSSSSASVGTLSSSSGNHLRGDASNKNNNINSSGDEGWKTLDPTCLANTNGLIGDGDDCARKTDSNGNACVWCDAGNDVFGVCANSVDKEYLGTYLNCDQEEESSDITTAVDFDALFSVE